MCVFAFMCMYVYTHTYIHSHCIYVYAYIFIYMVCIYYLSMALCVCVHIVYPWLFLKHLLIFVTARRKCCFEGISDLTFLLNSSIYGTIIFQPLEVLRNLNSLSLDSQ